MNSITKLLLAAALTVTPTVVAVQAQAQVSGIAVVDPDGAMGNSKAWKAAADQLGTTYKAQIDQAQARQKAIQAELQPLIAKVEADSRAPQPNQASLQSQVQVIQQKEQAGQQELAKITQPFDRAKAYAIEQIQSQLRAAIDAAAKRKNASIVLLPNGVAYMQPAADLTADVTTELDRLVPSVSITPPANWQPGQQGQGGAAAAAPRPGQSSGR